MQKSEPLNIVLFWFNDDWGVYGRAYQKVAEYLAMIPEVGRVVCVFPPQSHTRIGINAPLHIRSVTHNLILVSEVGSKISKLTWLPSRIRRLLYPRQRERAIKNYLSELGFRAGNTLLWLFPPHPYVEDLLNIIPRRAVISHIIDDFTKFDRRHELYAYARKQYPKVGQWSDFIITTSAANYDKFSKLGAPCRMFWPAVDTSFIGQPDILPYRKHGARPQLAYVGWIMERTDLDLIRYVATRKPEWDISLVGPQYPESILERSGLMPLPNIRYIGPIPQNEVPKFLQGIDICLMPHRDTDYSRSMGPLKLYQYLASGKPVVSTNVAGLDLVREHILVAHDYSEFVQHIESALYTDTPAKASARISAARRETWDVRIREMFDAVAAIL